MIGVDIDISAVNFKISLLTFSVICSVYR